MSGYLDRLRHGERLWAAEAGLRVLGIVLLGLCYRIAVLANALITAQPAHPTTMAEFVVCSAAFLLLTCGLALTFEGPGLLRHVDIPPHSAYFPRR